MGVVAVAVVVTSAAFIIIIYPSMSYLIDREQQCRRDSRRGAGNPSPAFRHPRRVLLLPAQAESPERQRGSRRLAAGQRGRRPQRHSGRPASDVLQTRAVRASRPLHLFASVRGSGPAAVARDDGGVAHRQHLPRTESHARCLACRRHWRRSTAKQCHICIEKGRCATKGVPTCEHHPARRRGPVRWTRGRATNDRVASRLH
jgi:hypothetical protein